MFSHALRQTLSRRPVVVCIRTAGMRRSVVRYPVGRRYESTFARFTNFTKQLDPQVSGIAAGATGGLVTLLIGYIWYNVSGTKKVIDASKRAIDSIESIQATITELTPSPAIALPFIHSAVKEYSLLIPDGGNALDTAFDELYIISDEPGEAEIILIDTYKDLKKYLQKEGMTQDSAKKASEIVRRGALKLKELGKDVGYQILEKYPQLKEKIGSSLSQLRNLGKKYGSDGQKIVDETYKQVQDIADKDLSLEAINSAANVVNAKTEELKELGGKLSDKAWEDSSKEVQKILDKMPEVKRILEQNMNAIKSVALSGGVSSTIIPQVFDQVKTISTEGPTKENIEKFQNFVEQKIREGEEQIGGSMGDASWQTSIQTLEKYLKTIPGGEKILLDSPDVSDLFKLAKKKGPEAERITKEAFEEIANVLRKKMQEVKGLEKETKEEVKQSTDK
ncbi:hypothetical protein RUND412_005160 [Rhizina undulata]